MDGGTNGATNLSVQNQAVVNVRDRARPADNFDRLGLWQSETAERHDDDRTPDETEPLHGLCPCFAAQTRPALRTLDLTVSRLARESGAAVSGEHHFSPGARIRERRRDALS
jgi:hypothetical protein